jgi:hypothetical protein
VVHSVTFKSDIPKNIVQELGDPQYRLSVYCGRYLRITSAKTLVYLRKNYWQRTVGVGEFSPREKNNHIRQAPR